MVQTEKLIFLDSALLLLALLFSAPDSAFMRSFHFTILCETARAMFQEFTPISHLILSQLSIFLSFAALRLCVYLAKAEKSTIRNFVSAFELVLLSVLMMR